MSPVRLYQICPSARGRQALQIGKARRSPVELFAGDEILSLLKKVHEYYFNIWSGISCSGMIFTFWR
jgi:hypothetical protein